LKAVLTQVFADVTQNPKAGAIVAAGTTGSGILTKINLNADTIGNVAILVGAILSIVLIVTHIRKDRREEKEHRKRMDVMDREMQRP